MNQKTFTALTWGSLVLSLALVFTAWGSGLAWDTSVLSGYTLFPLLGMAAWVTMANHYYMGSLRILNPQLKKPRSYGRVTGYAVLGFILLHPGILIAELWKSGYGLPPNSYLEYVGEGLRGSVLLGTFAFVLFLSFEAFMRLRHVPIITRHWFIVSLSQCIAMTLIFFHSLQIGSNLQTGWLPYVWKAFGLLLLPCFFLVLRADWRTKQPTSKATPSSN